MSSRQEGINREQPIPRNSFSRSMVRALAVGMGLCLVAVAAFFVYLALFLLVGINGDLLVASMIGLVGACGGVLSAIADKEPTLELPAIDEAGKFRPGVARQVAFGVAGAILMFMAVPGASGKAAKLGHNLLANVNATCLLFRKEEELQPDGTAGESPPGGHSSTATAAPSSGSTATERVGQGLEANDLAKGATLATADQSSGGMDWIELAALALIGGYAGRSVVDRASANFAKEDELRKVEKQTDEVERRVKADARAMRLYLDQIDVFTPPPNETELKAALEEASDETCRTVYVQTRARLHMYFKLFTLGSPQDSQSVERQLITIAERVRPIMEKLVEKDEAKNYAGSRFLLALALYLLGESRGERTPLNLMEEVGVILSSKNAPMPSQYNILRGAVDSDEKEETIGLIQRLVDAAMDRKAPSG